MNGTQVAPVLVRRVDPADPGDLTALREFFAGLSVRTRYRRFFAAVTPTAAMLRYLSGDAAGVDALVASCGGTLAGHAIAADRADGAGTVTTEIGVVVADGWQGHGVGSALTRSLLSAAQARGVTSVTMEVQHGNRRVLAMITSHWPGARTSHGPDSATVRIQLPRAPAPLRQPGPGRWHRVPDGAAPTPSAASPAARRAPAAVQ